MTSYFKNLTAIFYLSKKILKFANNKDVGIFLETLTNPLTTVFIKDWKLFLTRTNTSAHTQSHNKYRPFQKYTLLQRLYLNLYACVCVWACVLMMMKRKEKIIMCCCCCCCCWSRLLIQHETYILIECERNIKFMQEYISRQNKCFKSRRKKWYKKSLKRTLTHLKPLNYSMLLQRQGNKHTNIHTYTHIPIRYEKVGYNF